MASNTRDGPRAGQSAADQAAGSGAATRVADTARRIGVLSLHNSAETKAILNAVRALGYEPIWIRDENVSSWIDGTEVRLSPSVDVLINRLLLTKSETPFEDLQLVSMYEQTTPVVNSAPAVRRALHKYRAEMALADAGIPVPDAYFGRSPGTFTDWADHLPGEAVHKRTIGTNGAQMSRVGTDDRLHPAIQSNQSFVQEYLDRSNRRPADVRVYVVDGQIVGSMRRRAPDGEWRTNVALGAAVEDVTEELGPAPRSLARRAVQALDLDVAGVDLLPIDGDWYVLEVNATAGFKGLFSATDRSPAPYIVRLAIQRGGGSVDDRRIEELATTLDDRVPDCKPSRDNGTGRPTVIGLSNRIRLAGDRTGESVLAKADTGAKRTSLDTELAGRIGAGPIVGTTNIRSGSRGGTDTRPLVEVDLEIAGRWQSVTASVTDRSAMQYPVLLGRDVLDGFRVDISQRVEEE